MQTRVIHTRFWQDSFVLNLDREAKLLFIYLLTNVHINICGIYELPDQIIMLETGLTETQLANSKNQLVGKVTFWNGWVHVKNVEKYNKYRNSPKNEIAYEREMNLVPKGFPIQDDTSINTSMHTPRNPKPKILNQKSEIRNTKMVEKDFKELAQKFGVSVAHVQETYEALLDHVASKGAKYKDYKATVSNWIRRDIKEGRIRKEVKHI